MYVTTQTIDQPAVSPAPVTAPDDLVWGFRRDDRVRYEGTSEPASSWVGAFVDECTHPLDAGLVRCRVPGVPGLVRVRGDRLTRLGGAA